MSIITDKELELSIDDEMSVAEMMVSVYVNFLIKVREYAQSVQVDEIMLKVIGKKGFCQKKMYRYCNHADIRKLSNSIRMERKVEGERITPDWYMKQMIAKHVYEEFLQIYEEVDRAVNEEIPRIGNRLLEEKNMPERCLFFLR